MSGDETKRVTRIAIAPSVVPALLAALAEDLADAAVVAKAAGTCAHEGAIDEGMRIAIRLDAILGEAQTLHAAIGLIARRGRPRCGDNPRSADGDAARR